MAYPRLEDENPEETREWLAALEYILENEGTDRANLLLERLSARMTKTGERLPYTITTAYRNMLKDAGIVLGTTNDSMPIPFGVDNNGYCSLSKQKCHHNKKKRHFKASLCKALHAMDSDRPWILATPLFCRFCALGHRRPDHQQNRSFEKSHNQIP